MVDRKLLVKFQRKYELKKRNQLKSYSFTSVYKSADHNILSATSFFPLLSKYSSSFTETLDL